MSVRAVLGHAARHSAAGVASLKESPSAIDWMGIKTSLIVCFMLNIGSRLVMACTTTPWLLLLTLLGPNTIAGSLGVPVMTISVKRYTTELNRGFAFSLFYTLMNVAALSQGLLLDVFRLTFKDGFHIGSLDSNQCAK
ncbi:hypothetical protein NADE_006521 [Nannochloris sp. 'desiccata']|nr:hypothetical protein NADE_006521 [Chlorella desiccata (nom. nud.)]